MVGIEFILAPIFCNSELRLTEIDPREPITIGTTVQDVFDNLFTKIHKSEYLSFFSTNFWCSLLSPGIVMSIKHGDDLQITVISG